MYNTREKLIELFAQEYERCDNTLCSECKYDKVDDCGVNALVDHLIANGVTVQRKNPKRLTTEELNEMDDPVWVSCKTLEGADGYWCLCNKGIIICPSGQSFAAKEIPHWIFYRHKPKEG